MCVVKFSLVKHTCKIKKYIYSLHFLFLNRCIKIYLGKNFRLHLRLTSLGHIIFSLLGDWHSRLKSVDDMNVFEVIPRNSSSLLDFSVRDICNYYMEHSMRLNPKKVSFQV